MDMDWQKREECAIVIADTGLSFEKGALLMERLLVFIKKYIWIFIACYLILFFVNKFITLGGQGQLLILACVATAVPILGDYLTGRVAKQEQRRAK